MTVAKKSRKRSSVQKGQSEFVGLWLPDPMVEVIDNAVLAKDSDRSKFIRNAIREKLAREGFALETAK